MACGYPPPKGCGCQCGRHWHNDPYRPRYDIVCDMHDLGEQCAVCGDPKERKAV